MGLVPFGSTKKPAEYSGASSPRSPGRMPKNMTTPSIENDSGPPDTIMPAPEVDGMLRGHDRNYPRKSKLKS
jgi:hypothetical protein